MTFALVLFAVAAAPPPVVAQVHEPRAVAATPAGRVFAASGDTVVELADGKVVPFAFGLNAPKALAVLGPWLFAVEKDRVVRIDGSGKVEVVAEAAAFTVPLKGLTDIAADGESLFAPVLFVSDVGGAIYRVAVPPQRKGASGPVKATITAVKAEGLKTPAGLATEGKNHLLAGDAATGDLHRVRLTDGLTEKIAGGLGSVTALAWDNSGRLFVADAAASKLFCIPRSGAEPVLLPASGTDLCVDTFRRRLLVADTKAGSVVAQPISVPGFEVDESPLPLTTDVAFPAMTWRGWSSEDAGGKQIAFRPIMLTHAGDGSNRVFVGDQRGTIFAFANDQAATESKVFLDIRDKVHYDDKANEEGLLGLAFHPRYKETGEAFVYYTPKGQKNPGRTNVVARYRVKKDDPTALDPASEEIVFKFENRPFWNHAGGPIAFGPDGFLYIAHGDGGAANDPNDNGQNLGSFFGKILRIDVDKKADGKNYAVPADNPFVGTAGAKPEIYAYGLRNVWKMAFDRKTGALWAGEVGQNLFEEVNIIVKGGNYGWSRREAFHPFGAKGVGPSSQMIDPIWEYHHDIGKSITGGHVYRGPRLPELDGHYLYADYVSNRIWALKYDPAAKRVVANRSIPDRGKPVYAFGEDEQGEAYFMTSTPSGRECIFRFAK